MGGKIIKVDFSEFTFIPRKGGYVTVPKESIAEGYKQLHSHSVDLYAFRLIKKDGSEVVKLMNGTLVASYAHISDADATEYSEKHTQELLDAVTRFSAENYRPTRRNNKTIQARGGKNIELISGACDQGIIVGGWYNSHDDSDVSKQMLAYVMYCFAALNSAGPDLDELLLERVYHTLPRDTRYGKFDARAAQDTLLLSLTELHKKWTESRGGKKAIRFPQYS